MKDSNFPRKDYWFFSKSWRCSWVIEKRNFRPWMLCFSLSKNFLTKNVFHWFFYHYVKGYHTHLYAMHIIFFFFRAATNVCFVWRSVQNACVPPKKRWFFTPCHFSQSSEQSKISSSILFVKKYSNPFFLKVTHYFLKGSIFKISWPF